MKKNERFKPPAQVTKNGRLYIYQEQVNENLYLYLRVAKHESYRETFTKQQLKDKPRLRKTEDDYGDF